MLTRGWWGRQAHTAHEPNWATATPAKVARMAKDFMFAEVVVVVVVVCEERLEEVEDARVVEAGAGDRI